jgi:competence protein ComEC
MTDLRMAPAALAVWVAAWLLTGPGDARTGSVTWLAAAVVAAACLATASESASRAGRATRPAVAHTALAAACVLAVAVSAHAQLAGRTPLTDLAERRVTATLTGVVVSQPQPFGFAPGTGQQRWVLAARTVDARGVRSAARAHIQVLSGTGARRSRCPARSGPPNPARPRPPD